MPSPREVREKVLKSQLQIEKDLQRISKAFRYCSEDLDGFVHEKSRPLKKMTNKNKALKKKVIISAGKHEHSYALRGATN